MRIIRIACAGQFKANYSNSDATIREKAVWLEIPGRNHAQFGDYGVQKGDGTASISAQEQLRQTEDVILNMMNDPSGT